MYIFIQLSKASVVKKKEREMCERERADGNRTFFPYVDTHKIFPILAQFHNDETFTK